MNLYYDCLHCGRFGLTLMALPELGRLDLSNDPRGDRGPPFSYVLRRMQMGNDEPPLVDAETAKRIIDTAVLPSVQEQADNVVRYLGDHARDPGKEQDISYDNHGAIMGSRSPEGLLFILRGLEKVGLIDFLETQDDQSATLTFEGWRRWEELRRGAVSGSKAFMAMQYRDPRLDRIVNDWLRPAVEATGFRLTRLDDEEPAGLIDDRLRVEIQSARFLIADLTHENRGAFWEAGYAEGLGKPVIYTCEESVFNTSSHFDTNHHLHVLWNDGDLRLAAERLKATIRATIPEAKRQDDLLTSLLFRLHNESTV